ncbi:MAG: hypothetical protein ACI379_01415 [Nocardioides sp.]|uniref:hypothetical protein n=1 Tax=Nocardioides sp. TaxID=35761 RepID=UPI003F052A30
MTSIRTTTAALTATALLAAPVVLLTAGPANADVEKEREFRVAGAKVDFSVEKDDGRFDVDIDLDDAKRGSEWKFVLRHDGKVVYNKTRRADSDGEVDIDLKRPNTAGKDTFKLTVKKVGGAKKSSTISFSS